MFILKSRIFSCPWKWAVLVVLAVFIIYFPMIAPSVAPQADSGELVTAAYTFGIPHPPGYPLYTFIAHLFTLIPLGSVAWRVNLFSTICQALTIGVVYLILDRLTKNKLVAFGGSLVLAFSYTFWLYGLVAEVFALNDLFAVLIVYFSLTRRLFWVMLFFSLGFFHHLTIILLAPAAVYFLWPTIKSKFTLKIVLSLFLATVFGVIPYAYVLIVAKTRVGPVMWSFPNSVNTLIRLIFRSDYGTFAPTVGLDPAMALLSEKVSQVMTYFRFLLDDFLLLGIILGIVGIVRAFLKDRRLAIFLLLNFVFTGIFFISYANFPITDNSLMGLSVVERFYLLPNIFWAIFIAFGFEIIFVGLKKVNFGKILQPTLIGGYLFLLVFNHYSAVDQRGNYLAFNVGKNLLMAAPKDSLVYLQGDTLIYVTYYARYVENIRPDIELVTGNMLGPNNRFRYLAKKIPGLNISLPKTASISGFLAANSNIRPIAYAGTAGLPGEQLLPVSSSSGSPYFFPSRQDLDKHRTISDQALVYYGYIYMDYFAAEKCVAEGNISCAISYYNDALFYDPNWSLAKVRLEQLSGKNIKLPLKPETQLKDF